MLPPMSFSRLVLLSFAPTDLGAPAWRRIEAISDSRVLIGEDSPDLEQALSDADGLLLKVGVGADRSRLELAPRLRYIGVLGTGYGRVDTACAASRGITVCNVADYGTQAVAEFVFAVLLTHLRELGRARARTRAGDYSGSSFAGTQIGSRTFGVVGLGNIGRRVARIGHAGFGARTLYWSRASRADDPGIARVELAELLRRSDIISLHVQHSPQTEGLIDDAALSAMRPDAIVVNTAPMEIVSVPALERRLATTQLTFLADHADELAPGDLARLSSHPNCVLYPPVAYRTREGLGREGGRLRVGPRGLSRGHPGQPGGVARRSRAQ